jgi:hypothetical protein
MRSLMLSILFLQGNVLASSLAPPVGIHLAIDADFPDPSFVQAPDGAWYAFGTNGNGKNIQVASSPDFDKWTLLDVDALPKPSSWETDAHHWAPDVHLRVRKQQNHEGIGNNGWIFSRTMEST